MNDPRTSDTLQSRTPHRILVVMPRIAIALCCALLLAFRSDRLIPPDASSWAAAATLITLIIWALWPRTSRSSSTDHFGRWGALVLPALRSSNGTIGFVVMLLLGLLAPLLVPIDPTVQGTLLDTRLLPPLSRGEMILNAPPGSFLFLFGSDPIGRDVLSRLLIGTRTSLSIALDRRHYWNALRDGISGHKCAADVDR
jgi:hypothetical protein